MCNKRYTTLPRERGRKVQYFTVIQHGRRRLITLFLSCNFKALVGCFDYADYHAAFDVNPFGYVLCCYAYVNTFVFASFAISEI